MAITWSIVGFSLERFCGIGLKSNSTVTALATPLYIEFQTDTFQTTAAHPSGQWVKWYLLIAVGPSMSRMAFPCQQQQATQGFWNNS